MADLLPISVIALPEAGQVTGGEQVPIHQNGRLRRIGPSSLVRDVLLRVAIPIGSRNDTVGGHIATEIERAKAAEEALAAGLADETERAETAEGVLTAGLAAEIGRATAVEDATNLRTAGQQPHPEGTLAPWSVSYLLDGVLRSVARITPQGDFAAARFRSDAVPSKFGRALDGFFSPRSAALAYLDRQLAWCVQALRFAGNRGAGFAAASIVAAQRHMPVLEFLRSGRVRLALDPASLVEAQIAARRPPEDAIALGLPGQIGEVTQLPGPGRCLRAVSNADGYSAPYIIRRDLIVQGAHVLMPGSVIEAIDSYGQSWRTMSFDMSGVGLIGAEPRRALRFGGINNRILFPTALQGSAAGVDPILTFHGMTPGIDHSIGSIAAMAQQRLRARNGIHANAILDANHGYPGYRWDQLRPGTDPWTSGRTMRTKAAEIAALYGARLRYRGVGWTHGAPANGDVDGNGNVIDYYAALTEMVASFDGEGLNGPGGERLHFFTDQTAPISQATQAPGAILGQAGFALANSDRVHLIGPRYPYAFSDNIHHTALGTAQTGDLEGYVRHVVLDLGLPWTPCRPTAIVASGSAVTITIARPYGMGDLTIDTTQIEAAQSYGFRVRVGGAERTIESVVPYGDAVVLNLAQALPAGTAAEVSYAFYGPGAQVATHSGIWGNIKRPGPPSTVLINRDIDTWLTVFRETVTAS